MGWWWLVLVFFIQVIAELLLSPTGLSASTQLAPRGMESQVLALWFLATAVGDAIGGLVAGLQETLETPTTSPSSDWQQLSWREFSPPRSSDYAC